jgi:alanyl-tRNA synthetase
MSVETKTHTALHVLKGSIMKILGAKWTSSVWVEGNHGRLTVQYDRKPTDEEINEIQRLSNMKIIADSTVEVTEMSRRDAEAKWGNLIYDLFPLPEHIQILKILNIEDWNVNACNKDHTLTTGEIGGIMITKTRYRNNKNLLEVSFNLIE